MRGTICDGAFTRFPPTISMKRWRSDDSCLLHILYAWYLRAGACSSRALGMFNILNRKTKTRQMGERAPLSILRKNESQPLAVRSETMAPDLRRPTVCACGVARSTPANIASLMNCPAVAAKMNNIDQLDSFTAWLYFKSAWPSASGIVKPTKFDVLSQTDKPTPNLEQLIFGRYLVPAKYTTAVQWEWIQRYDVLVLVSAYYIIQHRTSGQIWKL